MKDSEQIARINSKCSEDIVAHVITWQLARVFRRDFNRMSYKMFLLSSKFNAQQRIILRLHEMQSALHALQNLVAKIPAPAEVAPADKSPLEIRLVSPEARILFDALMAMDTVMHRLLSQHDPETTEEICSDFFSAYGRLKYALFRKKEQGGKDEARAGDSATLSVPVVDTGEPSSAAAERSFSIGGIVDKLKHVILGS